jgi:hypothetical protein
MQTLERYADRIALLVCIAVLIAAVHFGARSAAGSDTFGYVSQAYLWLDGSLYIEQPVTRELPWPNPRESAAPLAFRSTTATRIVPVYPAGVPLIMAAFILVFGPCGPYLVAPLFGALLVAATYLLCRQLTGNRLAALVACALMATSPAFLFNVMQPMSDTVTSALWAMSLCALMWRGAPAAAAAGVLSGVAILARPNLAPLAIAGALAASNLPRAATYLLCGAVPASLGVAFLNDHLYGSPFVSGYERLERLYSVAHLPVNVWQFGWWLVISEGAVLAALALPLVVRACRPKFERRRFMAPAIFVGIVVSSYLFYTPYDAWWYLRFLLPAFPLFFAVAGYIAVSCVASLTPRAGASTLLFVAAASIVRVWPYADEIFTVGRGDDRYRVVAEFVERALPPNSVVLAMQHSGTLRFYAGRPTIRYEWFEAPRLPAAVRWLTDRGYRPYIVLENWEERWFRRRFAGAGSIGTLDVAIAGELQGPVVVRVYDPLLRREEAPPPFRITPRHRTCAAPSRQWRSVLASRP